MVRRVPRTGPALHQLTRVPEAAVSLVVDAVSVEPSLVWTIAVQKAIELDPRYVWLSTGWARCLMRMGRPELVVGAFQRVVATVRQVLGKTTHAGRRSTTRTRLRRQSAIDNL